MDHDTEQISKAIRVSSFINILKDMVPLAPDHHFSPRAKKEISSFVEQNPSDNETLDFLHHLVKRDDVSEFVRDFFDVRRH